MYAKLFTPDSTFLHAEFGKRRTRDGYILALLVPHELVFVKTTPFTDATHDALAGDLRAILGVVENATAGGFFRLQRRPVPVAVREP